MVSRQLFSLNEVQKNKYSYLGDNEKSLIKPYYDQRDNEALSIILDAATKKQIDQQIRVKSCITSQVIFYIQMYLDLLKQKLENKQEKTFQEALSDLKIGIIGCGIVGKSILNSLAFLLGWIEPNNIHISTRRPENLNKYEDIGFNIYFDNEKLVDQCDIIILCFPPSLDNWAIVELRDALQLRQQCQNRWLQPFIISVVSNLYINKLQKLLLTSRIFARTHIQNQEKLEDEQQFGVQLFSDKDLIKQLLIAFQFIFRDEKLKEEEFKLEEIDKTIQETLLGKVYNSLDKLDIEITELAAAKYEERQKLYHTMMDGILNPNYM